MIPLPQTKTEKETILTVHTTTACWYLYCVKPRPTRHVFTSFSLFATWLCVAMATGGERSATDNDEESMSVEGEESELIGILDAGAQYGKV